MFALYLTMTVTIKLPVSSWILRTKNLSLHTSVFQTEVYITGIQLLTDIFISSITYTDFLHFPENRIG